MEVKQCWNCRVDNAPGSAVCYNCNADLRLSYVEREGDNVTPIVIGIVVFITLLIIFAVTNPGLREPRVPQTNFLKLSSWDWKQSKDNAGIAEGEFLNRTPITYSNVSVRIDFADVEGNPVGAITALLKPTEFDPGARRSFRIPFSFKTETASATVSLLTPSGDKIRFLK